MDMKTLGLYDHPDGWRREPIEAFAEFVRSRQGVERRRPRSARSRTTSSNMTGTCVKSGEPTSEEPESWGAVASSPVTSSIDHRGRVASLVSRDEIDAASRTGASSGR